MICAYVRAKSDNSIIPKLFLRVFHLCTHEDQFPKGIQITCEEQQQLLGDEIAAHGKGHSRASQFFPHRFSSVRTATHNHWAILFLKLSGMASSHRSSTRRWALAALVSCKVLEIFRKKSSSIQVEYFAALQRLRDQKTWCNRWNLGRTRKVNWEAATAWAACFK